MDKIINIPDDWYFKLKDIIKSNYFKDLGIFINNERKTKKIFPFKNEVFKAFNLTPYQKVRVVILALDPYPNRYKEEPVACGLAFAPRNRNYLPPSLKVIYNKIKETVYSDELCFPIDINLESWAKQGILLLNSALTIEEGKSGSHLELWKQFTEEVFTILSNNNAGIIFCFWGKDALKFSHLINENFHHILKANHPVSAMYQGGNWNCDHFNRINEILMATNGDTIKWLDKP